MLLQCGLLLVGFLQLRRCRDEINRRNCQANSSCIHTHTHARTYSSQIELTELNWTKVSSSVWFRNWQWMDGPTLIYCYVLNSIPSASAAGRHVSRRSFHANNWMALASNATDNQSVSGIGQASAPADCCWALAFTASPVWPTCHPLTNTEIEMTGDPTDWRRRPLKTTRHQSAIKHVLLETFTRTYDPPPPPSLILQTVKKSKTWRRFSIPAALFRTAAIHCNSRRFPCFISHQAIQTTFILNKYLSHFVLKYQPVKNPNRGGGLTRVKEPPT